MRKLLLTAALAALFTVGKAYATEPVPKEYAAHIDPGGIVHCINPGTQCTAP